jgi:hypothetical protein
VLGALAKDAEIVAGPVAGTLCCAHHTIMKLRFAERSGEIEIAD